MRPMFELIEQILPAQAAPQHRPETVSVWVASEDPEVAAQVAPMLAARLYPSRTFGETVHVEIMDGGAECAVEVK
jgi:hypothetical protein